MSRNYRLTFILTVALTTAGAGLAQPVASGYFRGMTFQPMLDAEPQIVTADPAVVLVFSPTSQNADIVAKFDEWYRAQRPGNVSAFGVVSGTSEVPLEVVEEVLRQRDLKFPVFFTRSPIEGSGDRILVIRNGQAQTVTTFSAAEITTRLGAPAGLAIATATPAATIAPTPGIIASPTPVISTAPVPSTATVTTESVVAQPASKAGTYVNQRYDYTVTFPPGRAYITAQNSDGAVSKATDTSSLDFRVWASANNTDENGREGTMDMTEYLKRHLSFIAEEHSTRVNVDRKFQIRDQDIEGRDYTYTYVRTSPRTARRYEVRGRIQVFESNGIFKIANVEGDAEEFSRSDELIEQFILSFKPVTR